MDTPTIGHVMCIVYLQYCSVRVDMQTVKKMSDSVEYRSLVKCRDKLITAFKLDTVTVANSLVSSNLIPPAISSEIEELATSERKASRLVDCMFAKVEISHTHYNSFITMFSRFGWLSDIVEILNSTYSKLCTCQSRLCPPPPIHGDQVGKV